MNRSLVRLVMAAGLLCLVLALCASAPRAQGDTGKTYVAKCQMCHGPDGKGTAAGKALSVRDFHAPEVQSESDAALAQIVAKGKNKMPAYEKQLKESEIKDLVAYCKALGKK